MLLFAFGFLFLIVGRAGARRIALVLHDIDELDCGKRVADLLNGTDHRGCFDSITLVEKKQPVTQSGHEKHSLKANIHAHMQTMVEEVHKHATKAEASKKGDAGGTWVYFFEDNVGLVASSSSSASSSMGAGKLAASLAATEVYASHEGLKVVFGGICKDLEEHTSEFVCDGSGGAGVVGRCVSACGHASAMQSADMNETFKAIIESKDPEEEKDLVPFEVRLENYSKRLKGLPVFNKDECAPSPPHRAGRCGIFFQDHAHYSYNKSFLNLLDKSVATHFVENVSNRRNISGFSFSMFNSLAYDDQHRVFSAARYLISGKNGLGLAVSPSLKTTLEADDIFRRVGFDIEAEDPRLVVLNEKQVFVVFIARSRIPGQERGIAITPFEDFRPVFLQLKGVHPQNKVEKNWAPFAHNDAIYFVYNWDPLVVLKYDLNQQGLCDVVFKQGNVGLPFATATTHLRGGSNLVQYQDNLFLGGCHSRIHFKGGYYHFSHLVIINVKDWKIVHVSRPMGFSYNGDDLGVLNHVLLDRHPFIIQDPVSLSKLKDEKHTFHLTVNVRDAGTNAFRIILHIDTHQMHTPNAHAKTHSQIAQYTHTQQHTHTHALFLFLSLAFIF